jgi:PAS domain S-box-containing protein
MSIPLRILYVEDSHTDAELVIRELTRSGFEPTYQLVMSEADFLAGLETLPDLILSDYALPQFDGMRALNLLHESSLEIPFILISGTLGEEAAVTSIKHGAADYVMKDRLSRLGSAVNRALEEQKLRSERKLAEAALKQSEACLRIVSNFARIGFVVVNSEYRVVFANAAFTEIFNLSNADITEEYFSAVVPEDYEAQIRPRLDQAFVGVRSEYELRLTNSKGNCVYAINYEPVLDGTLVNSVVVVVMDITARRNTEEQLRQSQKMEAVGQLAGGIAHDFNNMLTVISTYASLLLLNDSLQPEEQHFVNEIGKASQRAADLTRRLLAFSRGQLQSPVAVDLNEVIGEMQKLLVMSLGRSVDISLLLEPLLKHIWIDRNELSQILMNLSLNARDAMQSNGRLVIRTQSVEIHESDVASENVVKPGSYALLTVSDSGCGMTDIVKQKIFEPFFTTKPVGKGTGLGLSIVHAIVARCGGFIQVTSGVGQGTSFQIYFPLMQQEPETASNSVDPQRSLRGTETILLVDDDDMVRQAMVSILTDYGYNVIEAENGEKAMRIFQQQPQSIQLLITDQMMPEMNGATLVENVLQLTPHIPILMVSGYITEDEILKYSSDKNMSFLQKPFQPQFLASKVREVLERNG